MDATGTRDPDGDALKYMWFFCPEAGTGIPGQPVFAGGLSSDPPQRVMLEDAHTSRTTVTPRVAGTAHVILTVEDDGLPSLSAYRRVILTIKAARPR